MVTDRSRSAYRLSVIPPSGTPVRPSGGHPSHKEGSADAIPHSEGGSIVARSNSPIFTRLSGRTYRTTRHSITFHQVIDQVGVGEGLHHLHQWT